MRNVIGKISLGVNFLKPVTKLFVSCEKCNLTMELKKTCFLPQVELNIWKKASSNVYVPTIINIKLDICESFKTNQSTQAAIVFFTAFYPPFAEKFSNLLHPCPFKVVKRTL
jgi:hypothetical protein